MCSPYLHFLTYIPFTKSTPNQINKEKEDQHKQIQFTVNQRDGARTHSKNFLSACKAANKSPLRRHLRHLPWMLTQKYQWQEGILYILFALINEIEHSGNKDKRQLLTDGMNLFWVFDWNPKKENISSWRSTVEMEMCVPCWDPICGVLSKWGHW